jgi:hypothetical protein
MSSFTIFDEGFYLEYNPDAAAAVASGTFSSGLEHFRQIGLQEGRTLVSPFYNENTYLANYPDVAAAVASGVFNSGLDHYIQFGEAQGRSGIPFAEEIYLEAYPDVAAAVADGIFNSGLDHYIQYGRFEESRFGYFTGTTENDTITGFGTNTWITGIDAVNPTLDEDGRVKLNSREFGTGEVDTLISGAGSDIFYLGNYDSGVFQNSYVGDGSADYALIKNFEPGKDAIQLAGYSTALYRLGEVNGNFHISTLSGDLMAIVEGVTSLSVIPDTGIDGLFEGRADGYFLLG